MAADLTARFQLIDEMSDKLGAMAQSGQSMVETFENATENISASFSTLESGVVQSAQSIDGVAHSIEGAAGNTDHWTDAVGNYSKSILDAVYSTEELVNMGLKSADALEEMEEMYDLCDRSAEHLNMTLEATTGIQEELASVMDEASRISSELADNENISAETSERLATAYNEAEQALQEVQRAEENARTAMEEYNAVMISGSEDMAELEAAAERAGLAAEELAEANGKASEATEKLSKATEQASDEAKNAGETGQEAAEKLASALTAAGIAQIVKEIADAFLEASNAAGEFEFGVTKISTIADTTAISLSDIQSGISSLSRETGESVDGLSEAVYSAISASVDTADAVNFTSTATKLASGGFTQSATAVDVLTTALNAYGLEADKAENISDMLITTQNLGKTTVDELAASVGKVIPLASAYGVEMDNLSAAYAELTKGGIATAEAGTYLKSMLNELGDSGSTVGQTLVEETGTSFGQLMQQGKSLGDVMEILGASVEGDAGKFNELWSSSEAGIGALSIFNAGAEQYNTTLDAMQNSMGATEDAFNSMSNTAYHSQQELSTAVENMQISVGAAINPMMEKIYNAGTDILNQISEFASEHPMVTKAVSAIATGLGVAAVGMVAVTTATTVAIPAIVSFGTALNAALGPVGWVALGITAVTTAVAAFVAMSDSGETASERLTYASREHEAELENLNARYDEAVQKYGATSEQAGQLALEISRLESAYGDSGKTIGEFTEEINRTGEAIADIQTKYEDAMTSATGLESGSMNLASQLMVLSSQSDLTGADLEMMDGIIGKLNDSYGELGLAVDKTTGKMNMSVPELYSFIQEKADEQKKTAATDALTDAIASYGDARKQMQDAYSEVGAAWDSYEEQLAKWQEEHPIKASLGAGSEMNWDSDLGKVFDDWEALKEASTTAQENYNALNDQIRQYCETLGYTAEETDDFIAQLEASADAMADMGNIAEETAEKTITSQEAAALAYQSVQSQIEALCTAYDEAYNAAVESFDGQFGLFDEAQANAEASVEAAQKAMDSQLDYWSSYSENIKALQEVSASDLGITQENYEALMAFVQSGSEEAAGLAASMVESINAGNEEAVGKLAETLGQVEEAQSESAAAVASWQTDFDASLTAITQSMNSAIEEMDLTPEAEAAAKSTIEGYIAQIEAGIETATTNATAVADGVNNGLDSGAAGAATAGTTTMNNYASAIETAGSRAVMAAQSIASQVSAALAAANTNININTTGSVPAKAKGAVNAPDMFIAGEDGPELIARAAAYANGTTDSQPFYIAGENGPELIIGEQGSTVFPTQETERILSAIGNQKLSISEMINPANITVGGDGDPSVKESLKRIVLEISGGGSIDISGGTADTDTILELIMQNIRPALLSILRTDILEEGDLSYDF